MHTHIDMRIASIQDLRVLRDVAGRRSFVFSRVVASLRISCPSLAEETSHSLAPFVLPDLFLALMRSIAVSHPRNNSGNALRPALPTTPSVHAGFPENGGFGTAVNGLYSSR